MLRIEVRLVAFGLLLGLSGWASAADPGFVPIFDGTSLSGWRGDANFWRVEEGTIVAESTEQNPCKENTFLVWDQGAIAALGGTHPIDEEPSPLP